MNELGRTATTGTAVAEPLSAGGRYAVFDALNGALLNDEYVARAVAEGVRTVHVTVNNFGSIMPNPSLRQSLTALAAIRRRIGLLRQAYLVRNASDLEGRPGELGVVLGYQNMPGIGRDLDMLDLFRDLDVLIVQISHNFRNFYADGCSEPANAPLSATGVKAVKLMNDLGIAIDLSHTGEASSIDVLECSSQPVAITHANAYAIAPNARNKSDPVLSALAKNDGVIGISYLPPIVHVERQPATVDDVIAHIDYVAEKVGPRHIGIGSDFIEGQPSERYEEFMRQPEVYGTWPWRFAITDLSAQNRLFEELLKRGYSEDDVAGIAGGNFRRLLSNVWSARRES